MNKNQRFIFSFVFLIMFCMPLVTGQGRYSEVKNNYIGKTTLKWINPLKGIPENAVIGDIKNGIPVFIARGYYNGRYYPGRTTENMKVCIIGYKGKEIHLIDYQILVVADGTEEYENLSDKQNMKFLELVYEISDTLKTEQYAIFINQEMLKKIKLNFKKLRQLAIEQKNSVLARKIDKIIDKLKGSFVKLDDVKKDVNKLEKMF